MATQGGHANKTGNVLERTVIGTITAHGFVEVKYSDYVKNPDGYGEEVLLKHVPFTTLYKGRGYTEFVLLSEKFNLRTRIECKWQTSAGSVDEKLPHTYLSCIEGADEDEVIILIDGPGFREGALNWLREAASERRYIPDSMPRKNISIMSVTEFMVWTNKIFR